MKMKGALVILIFTVLVGIVLYLFDLVKRRRVVPPEHDSEVEGDSGGQGEEGTTKAESNEGGGGECCGLHLVCEKELEAVAKGEILYYDDEELDRFADRDPDSYTAEEMEEFRDVLMTLLPVDVAGWARSLDARHIRPPREIRDELLMLLSELV